MKNSKILIFGVVALSVLTSCQSKSVKPNTATLGAQTEANLTRQEADLRAQAVRDVEYQLAIELDEKSEIFTAQEEIHFSLQGPVSNLFLDFKDTASIQSFSINDKVLPPSFGNHRLQLPSAALKAGVNQVRVNYTQNYSHEGRGLHHFVDPEDGKVYLYSQFEAYDAHQMFPCFDQPDIKAVMTMSVRAPKSWEVITSVRETEKKAQGDFTLWVFPKSVKMSSYLFSLHAGPYFKWESKAGNIPLRLFARQSLKSFVRVKEWFTPTQQGLKFFGDYFAYPYPFKKYDQVIAPEFNAHAMENVAAVTFRESFIERGPSTRENRDHLTGTILHEMAHMWFGDLVTMQWWNGLWLNESFATYMASLAKSKATEFKKEAWIEFLSFVKDGAYEADELVTSHPIETEIVDTHSAFSNFDSITYGKGASAHKQLSFYLGEKVFQEGIRYYFQTHAFGNARLEDYIGAMEHASGKDLKEWSDTWLRKKGLDTIQAKFNCGQGKITDFSIEMNMSSGPHLTHRTEVALYDLKKGRLSKIKSASVIYSGASTPVKELVGSKCPVLVMPNEGDQDYVKVHLDPQSIAAAQKNLNLVKEDLPRLMLWKNLFTLLHDVELTPQDFLKVVSVQLPQEMSLVVGSSVLDMMRDAIYYLPKTTPEEKSERLKTITQFENLLWKKIEASKPGSDWQQMLVGSYVQIAASSAAQETLLGLLSEKVRLKGYVLSVDRQWDILITLEMLGVKEADIYLEKLRASDKSDRGVELAMLAEAAKPSSEVKMAWEKRLVDDQKLSFTQKRTVMQSFLPPLQDEFRQMLSQTYFTKLPNLIKTSELQFAEIYAWSMAPITCSQKEADQFQNFMNLNSKDMPTPVRKVLQEFQDRDRRCISIRTHTPRAKSE